MNKTKDITLKNGSANWLRMTLMALLVFAFTACDMDFIDPTPVENPQATDQDLANATNPTRALLPGVKAQFSRAVGGMVLTAEFVSDNASINGTGIGGTALDFPRAINSETPALNSTGVLGSYWNLQELKALTNFIINDIIPGDENATDNEIAQVYFYRGMSLLILGENFVGVPIEETQQAIGSQALLNLALEDFDTALQSNPSEEFNLAALAAKARTYRALGNGTEASSFAADVLAIDSEFLYTADFDSENLFNRPWTYAVDRALKELQPSPRLDFLDPKYTSRGDPIPVLSAEEMYLIRAEVEMSNGNYGVAAGYLSDASDLALTTSTLRPRVEFNDGDERLNNNLNPRPRDAEIEIRADEDSPFVSGLVLTRPGVVMVSKVSWTSVTRDQIEAVPTSDEEELRRLLYLLRQEIMFYEGRRMHDLGIRLPMMQREWDNNIEIDLGDFGTEVFVPPYIPPQNELDLFTPFEAYENGTLTTTEITMLHDLNKILSNNRGLVIDDPFVGVAQQ